MATGSSRIVKSIAARTLLQEHSALLQRVLRSRLIEKSLRIRDLLVYVSDRILQDPTAEIHEQEIGHKVFGRSADYDTGADNIVRVTASQARKKLEQYFASEGAGEPTILEIPKGQYTPVFRQRIPAVAEIANEAEAPARNWKKRTITILAVSAPVLAIIAVWLAVALRSERLAARSEMDANPTLRSLWSQLLPRDGRTDIVVTDSSLSLFQELLDRQLTLPGYLKPELWGRAEGLASNPDLRRFAQQAVQRRFTSLASVTTAYRIAQLAGQDRSHVSILSARDFHIRQMRGDNVILLGSSRANPWIDLIVDRLNFRFGLDRDSKYAYFENREPHPGEPKMYRTDSSTSYCQIAFLPNLGRTGNILAISGTEVEGTEGGGEFVTNELVGAPAVLGNTRPRGPAALLRSPAEEQSCRRLCSRIPNRRLPSAPAVVCFLM
jgi:hypothetical protein